MTTEKGEFIRQMFCQMTDLLNPTGQCMVCEATDQETVDKIAEVLKEYGIDPKQVEEEMLKITDNFSFSACWIRPGSKGCYVYHRDFYGVLYHLLLK